MNIILYNGKIRIKKNEYKTAVLIRDGYIAALGQDEEILRLANENTQVINLNGKLTLPGFNDSHMHFLNIGYNDSLLDLTDAVSIDDAIEKCKNFVSARQLKPGQWVECFGWNEDLWPEKRNLDRYDLDQVSKENPIVAVRVCGHILTLNSKALEIVGIDKNQPKPVSGDFFVDSEGEPTGVLFEMLYRIHQVIPHPTVQEIKEMILSAADKVVKSGLTSVQTDDFECIPGHSFVDVITAYTQLTKADELPIRVYQQCALGADNRFEEFFAAGYDTKQGDDMFKLGPLKLFCDGSLGSRTAWLKEPYADQPDTCGFGLYPKSENLYSIVDKAHRKGMAVAIHCIGDAAVEQAVEAIERAKKANPQINNRHGIVHGQILNDDLVERIKKSNIIVYIQPIFIEYDLHMAEDRIGAEKMRTSYNWKTLKKNNIKIPFGTDCPVEDYSPLPNIYSAVTRKDLEGLPGTGWYKEEGLTLDESIDCYTIESAYASYEEDIKGSIEIGKWADITVLEEDIFQVKPEHIKDCQVAMTIVAGKIRYNNL